MYGEKRLGVIKENKFLMKKPTQNGIVTPVIVTAGKPPAKTSIYPLGKKHYETTDWLGNVRVTYTDKKSWNNGKFALNVSSSLDYYPFGSVMEGRKYNLSAYRYAFNTQERVPELNESHYTALYWEYDPRVVMRWNIDPKPNPSICMYSILQGNPIWYTDHKGDTIRVTTSEGKYLFSLDDGQTKLRTMTAKQVYAQGIQWFEPLADNYMPLLDKAKDLSTNSSLKHFTWQQIADFSEKNRWMFSYRQGGSGDWKASKEGADGYFLITVDGYPYWSDAIGQIPFAVDYFTDIYEDNGNKEKSIMMTIQKGREYGEGKLFGGKTDNSNNYDIYFILRGAKWASKRYNAVKGSGLFGDDYDLQKTEYLPSNLEKSISENDAKKYLSR